MPRPTFTLVTVMVLYLSQTADVHLCVSFHGACIQSVTLVLWQHHSLLPVTAQVSVKALEFISETQQRRQLPSELTHVYKCRRCEPRIMMFTFVCISM